MSVRLSHPVSPKPRIVIKTGKDKIVPLGEIFAGKLLFLFSDLEVLR
jgi:hypothetical protein